MPFDAGSIEARLTLDRSAFQRELDRARADALGFTEHPYEARIRADTRQFRSDINSATNDLRRLGDEENRAAAAGTRTEQSLRRQAAAAKEADKANISLLGTLLALSPAVVPLAGAAGLAGAALVNLGAAGILAFKGIQNEIKNNTGSAMEFSASLQVVKTDLTQLETTAAHGVLTPFHQAVTQLHSQMPQLNADMGRSSVLLGSIAGHVLGGLVGGLHNFIGPIQTVETGVDHLAARFESWATGPGGAKFASALDTDLRRVAPTLGQIGTLIERVVAASNGAGLTIVDEIGALARALNALPLPVLSTLITGLSALKIVSTINGLFAMATVGLRRFTVAEEAAGAGATRLAGQLGTEGAAAGAAGAGAAAGGRLARTGAFLSRGLGIAALAYLGGNAANSMTMGMRSSPDAGEALLGGVGSTLGNIVNLRWGSILSDLRAQRVARDNFDREYNLARYYTVGRNTRNTDPFNSPRGTYLTAAGDSVRGIGSQTYTNNQGFAAIQQGGRLIEGRTAAKITTAGVGSYKVLTNQEYELAKATQYVNDAQTKLNQAFGQVRAQAPHQTMGELANSYTALATNVQKSVDNTAKWLSQGGRTITTLKGVAIGEKTWDAALRETNGDHPKAIALIEGRIMALRASSKEVQVAQQREQRLQTLIGGAAQKYHLTADQVSMYAQAVGISADRASTGAISQRQFNIAIGQVSRAVNEGSTAVQGWVAAVAQFQKGADTAASRGQLLGAALVALNGDTIAYQNTQVAAATANQQLVTDLGSLQAGVLNLRTGMLDYHNAAAAPVLGDLQNLQTAASNAAAATYQHEVRTKGMTRAAHDAAVQYRSMTYGALKGEAQQLGLTSKEANKLAKEYFGLPKNVITRITQLGGNDTNNLLRSIGGLLAKITHTPWKFDVNGNLSPAQRALDRLDHYLKTHNWNIAVGVETGRSGQKYRYVPGFGEIAIARGGLFQDGARKYANGGMENHNPFIYPAAPAGKVRVFAEPETKGEAYIPLANDSRRPRAQMIAAETVRLLGGAAFFANGGGPNYYHGVNYGNSGGGGSGGGGGKSGGSGLGRNATAIAQYLRNQFGFSDNQIAGFLGNFKIESGFNPNAYNAGENAHGIAQWEGSRWTHLQSFARRRHQNPESLKTQIAFLGEELRSNPNLIDQIKRMNDPGNIAAVVDAQFERSAGTTRGARIAAARSIARHIGNLSGGSAAANSGTTTPAQTARNNARAALHSELGRLTNETEFVSLAKGARANIIAYFDTVNATLREMSRRHMIGDPVVERFLKDNKRLDKALHERDLWRAKLANRQQQYASDRQAAKQYSGQVRDSFLGAFDIGTSGNGYAYGIKASLDTALANEKKYGGYINKARHMHLAPRLINQLLSEGPQGAANLEAIVNAGQKYVNNINKEYGQFASKASSLGHYAETLKYSKLLAADTRSIREAQAKANYYQKQEIIVMAEMERILKRIDNHQQAIEHGRRKNK